MNNTSLTFGAKVRTVEALGLLADVAEIKKAI